MKSWILVSMVELIKCKLPHAGHRPGPLANILIIISLGNCLDYTLIYRCDL